VETVLKNRNEQNHLSPSEQKRQMGLKIKKPSRRNVRYGSPVISIQLANNSPRLKSNSLSERRQQPERQRRASEEQPLHDGKRREQRLR
jgi:hypothetical protein